MGFLKLIVQVFFVCVELSWVGGEGWGQKGGGPKSGGQKGGGQKGGAPMFLLFPLSASSLRCVCIARYLSCGSSCPAGERTHTLGAKCCHIMFLFGL